MHAGCGIWGLLSVAAFAAPGMVMDVYGASPYGSDVQRSYGFIMGGDASLLGAQVVGIIAIFVWVSGEPRVFGFRVW